MADEGANGALSGKPDGPAESSADSGWEGVSELLSGFRPDQIPFLAQARELEPTYLLLHALAHGSLRDFIIRVAALEALIADGRTPFTPAEVVESLYWLKDQVRDSVLAALRRSGWLSYRPDSGYRVTDAGRFVATVLSFLRARVREGSVLPAVEGIDYMLNLGVDPTMQLKLLRSQLENLRTEMENARSSHSEVILRGAAARLRETLEWSERIRAILARVTLDMPDARRSAHDVHDLLSRLHGVAGDLHAAITEVGRQHLPLVAGMTATDIIGTLMRLPVEELSAVGREALRPAVTPPVFVVPELLVAEAEAYLARRREPPPKVDWTVPPEPDRAGAEMAMPPDVAAWLDDLDRLAEAGAVRPLVEVVPRGSAAESFLRASLLPLLGEAIGGEGVAGRIGALPLAVTLDGDGFPAPAPKPLSALTPGTIGPPAEGTSDG
jgi:hypothetical protein